MKSKKKLLNEPKCIFPNDNPNLLGHQDVLDAFFHAYQKGNLPGTWLISGPKGIGKATLAYRLARFVLYNGSLLKRNEALIDVTSNNLAIPQGSAVYTKVSMGSHPDLLVLQKNQELKGAGDILVDDVRAVADFLHLTSAESKYKIVIIDSIDNLNNNAANAILKLLEEPAKNAIFLLVSHAPGRLLPTIRSRCRHMRMKSLDDDVALQVLQSAIPEIPEAEAKILLEYSAGSPGIAYNIYVNNGLKIAENITKILSQLPKLDMLEIHKLADLVSGKKNEDSWSIIKILLNKIIVDSTKVMAINNSQSKIINEKFKLLVAIDPKKLVQIWEETNSILEEAEKIHLDRKAVLVKVFTLFVRK